MQREFQEKISEIGRKVKESRGEVILSWREFSIPGKYVGGFIGYEPKQNYNYYSAGIIDGELHQEKKCFVDNIFLEPNFNITCKAKQYHFLPHFSIPIDKKIHGFLNYFYNNFNIRVDQLEQLNKGNILFSSHEMGFKSVLPSKEDSCLKNFSLLIGDNEVKDFLEEKKIGDLEEFFDTFKKPSMVEAKIAKHYHQERKFFGNNLVLASNQLFLEFAKIKSIESILLKTKYDSELEQDGILFYWDNPREVFIYSKSKEKISKQIPEIIDQLNVGKKLYSTTEFPLISGDEMGFHGKVTFQGYSDWLKDEKIPEMKKTICNIDEHLSEAKREAGC